MITKPKKPIDIKVLGNAASIGCTMDEMAALCGVGRRTLFERVEAEPELKEAIETGRSMGRATLRRLQWQGASAGNATMLIWLGKQVLNQTDKLTIRKIKDWSDLSEEELAVLAQSAPEEKETRH